MFSEAVLDHFRNPRNSGSLPEATMAVEASNPVCGDVVQLFVILRDRRFERVTFLCRGCTTSIACASWLTECLTGRTLEEAAQLTAAQISEALGGLPPATAHGAQLAIDALQTLLRTE